MAYKNVILSSVMIVAIALAAWTTLSYRPQNAAPIHAAELPDAYMEDVTAVILNKQGKMDMKIKSPKMTHFATNDTTHLTTPQLTLYKKSPQPWYITSNFAKASQGIENVNFWDNVIIHHAADLNNRATLIKTLTLTVHPTLETAETSDPITLIQEDIVIQATGMLANLNNGDIKLLSKTRGEYAPTS